MRVAVIGGGPAGLFFATLLKRDAPRHEVTVLEQNPAGASYGFGVVLTDIALRFLDAVDPELRQAIVQVASCEREIILTHRGEAVRVTGNTYHGIARLDLLRLLREKAKAAGVRLVDDVRVTSLDEVAGHDLVVGADGLNSAVRALLQERLGATRETQRNVWAWYGTPRRSAGVHLLFQQTEHGLFIGHTYPYGREGGNTFVVECSPAAWRAAGLDRASDAESRSICEAIFSDFLEGKSLLSNRSTWFNPTLVRAHEWSWRNVVLIGDALKTVHPTIGSGTRVAMQDAIALAGAFREAGEDVAAALRLFEERRRPDVEGFQDAARRSIAWYDSVEERLDLTPLDFTYDFMTRTGKVDHERLRRMAPEFIRAYEAAHADPAVA
jgi:anthraniloyl-CoA monooxygenase